MRCSPCHFIFTFFFRLRANNFTAYKPTKTPRVQCITQVPRIRISFGVFTNNETNNKVTHPISKLFKIGYNTSKFNAFDIHVRSNAHH